MSLNISLWWLKGRVFKADEIKFYLICYVIVVVVVLSSRLTFLLDLNFRLVHTAFDRRLRFCRELEFFPILCDATYSPLQQLQPPATSVYEH